MRQSLLFISKHAFTLQTNAFIASDEIVFAPHLQVQITLQTNMFIASENTFCAGGEHFGAGDEHV